jgi:pimeloyl-ACP methyl ester carboxylesterase
VVLLQGIGLSSRFWFEQPEVLSQDEGDPYRVLLIDNRGTGRSDAPRGTYRMATMADDVAAAMDAAGVPSAIVVGISMGGMIAQHVALRHPDKVQGLVLLATTMGLPHGRLPSPSALGMLLSLPLRGAKASRNLARLLIPEKDMPRAREVFKEWVPAMKESPIAPHAFFGQFAAVLGHSTGFRLRKIRCPVVVVSGKDDILIPARNSELLAKRIPNAALEIIPDAAHGIPLLDRSVVRRALDRLRTLPAAFASG